MCRRFRARCRAPRHQPASFTLRAHTRAPVWRRTHGSGDRTRAAGFGKRCRVAAGQGAPRISRRVAAAGCRRRGRDMSDVDDEEVLRSNLQVPALSPEALARIRRATEAEWRVQAGGPPRRLWLARAAVAAGAVLALIGAWQFWMSGTGG